MSSNSYDERASRVTDHKQYINDTLVVLAQLYLGTLVGKRCAYLEASECVTTNALLTAGVRASHCYIANTDSRTVQQIQSRHSKVRVYHRSWYELLEHRSKQYDLVFADYCGTTFGLAGDKNCFDDIDLLYGLQRVATIGVVAFTFSVRKGGENSIDNFRGEHGRIALQHGYHATEVHNLSYGCMRLMVFAVAYIARQAHLLEPAEYKQDEEKTTTTGNVEEFEHEVLDNHTYMARPDSKVTVLLQSNQLVGKRIQHNFKHQFGLNGKKKAVLLWCKGVIRSVSSSGVLLVEYHNGDTCKVVLDHKQYGPDQQWFLYR